MPFLVQRVARSNPYRGLACALEGLLVRSVIDCNEERSRCDILAGVSSSASSMIYLKGQNCSTLYFCESFVSWNGS